MSLHPIVDNYPTHKHAERKSRVKWHNQRFRKAHGIDRVVMHFTPTSSSWMNLVERFFRDLTQDVIRGGSFSGVGELVQAITGYLQERNLNPKPYVCDQRVHNKADARLLTRSSGDSRPVPGGVAALGNGPAISLGSAPCRARPCGH